MDKNRFSLAFRLLKQNIKKIIIFEAIYKLLILAILTPLCSAMIRFAMKLSGIRYITNARLINFLLTPSTIAILVLIIILLCIFCLMEMASLAYCYNATYNNIHFTIMDMFKAGTGSAIRLLRNNNFLMIMFVLVLVPVTHIAAISGYISASEIPQFLIEFLKTKQMLIMPLVIIYGIMCIFAIRWINSINYYIDEKMNFRQARKASTKLNKGAYPGLIISYIIWQLFIFMILVIVFVVILFIITNSLKIVLSAKKTYTISLYIARKMVSIWVAIYSCITVPITFSFLSAYYFKRKNKIGEAIVLPKEPKHKKREQTKFKQIMSVVFFISAILNIIYVNTDGGIFGTGTSVQLLKKVVVAAHRGDSVTAPENTMSAFKMAVENTADYAELDVQETKDGEVVVLHDSNLKRVGDLDKKIWKVDYSEISELDVGKWFSKKYKGELIPKLEDVLKYSKGKLKLNIEIKLTGHEKNLEKSVVDLIEEYKMEDDCVVTSFQAKALKNVKSFNPDIKTGYILHVAYGDFSNVTYADALSVNYSFASQTLINDAHNAGKEVYVWTVNSADDMNTMIDRGADMLITDDPVLARETITAYETTPWLIDLVKYLMGNY